MKTVKVRIAVAVDPTGAWNAAGWSGASDDSDKMGIACDHIEDGEARYWVEAELAIPEVPVVDGTVSEGETA